MKTYPIVNLGQSQFQDTFFVAGAQLTPFRQLRQLELQINELEVSLKKADINYRRTQLKISKLDLTKEEDLLNLEEWTLDLKQQDRLVADAESRLANFYLMRDQLMDRTPPEYWEQGYEQAEIDHWQKYLARQMTLLAICPDKHLSEQLMLLPEEMRQNVIRLSSQEQQEQQKLLT